MNELKNLNAGSLRLAAGLMLDAAKKTGGFRVSKLGKYEQFDGQNGWKSCKFLDLILPAAGKLTNTLSFVVPKDAEHINETLPEDAALFILPNRFVYVSAAKRLELDKESAVKFILELSKKLQTDG